MDATTLQAMNAYLQSIAGSTGAQPAVTIPTTTAAVPQMNPLEQYYQNQYTATLNSNLVNQQLLNLLIQSQIPTSTVPNPVNNVNSVYPGILDPASLLVLSQTSQQNIQNQNMQNLQNQQIQMLAMELNRQASQIQPQSLPVSAFSQNRQQPQGFQIPANRTSVSPNSDSDSIASNGRKRRHREEIQTQVKQSHSQGGSPTNFEVNGVSPQIRNRSYTCPESLKQKKEILESDANKRALMDQSKSEVDPGSPQRHHPDNVSPFTISRKRKVIAICSQSLVNFAISKNKY